MPVYSEITNLTQKATKKQTLKVPSPRSRLAIAAVKFSTQAVIPPLFQCQRIRENISCREARAWVADRNQHTACICHRINIPEHTLQLHHQHEANPHHTSEQLVFPQPQLYSQRLAAHMPVLCSMTTVPVPL